jgi:hypothetical protein
VKPRELSVKASIQRSFVCVCGGGDYPFWLLKELSMVRRCTYCPGVSWGSRGGACKGFPIGSTRRLPFRLFKAGVIGKQEGASGCLSVP